MRILVVSNLYPPVARGGFEVECSSVVEHLSREHDVVVLTTELDRNSTTERADVWRELPFLTDDWRGAMRAPVGALRAVKLAHRALSWRPDLVYVWNASSTPQAAVRVLADGGLPIAFRVCSHLLAELFIDDQFMRELSPAHRHPARAVWSAGCRALNTVPALRLQPRAPFKAAVCWNAQTMKRLVQPPPFVELAFERVIHSVPRYGDLYAEVVRAPAPTPEILFIGRVTEFKGLAVAIEALKRLRDTGGGEARLVVMGPEDVDYGSRMRSLARRLGVDGSITWRGACSPEQVAEGLARAHVLIVPSTWPEPFPLVTIEAALAGVPVVASDVGGISEGMHDGEHALLFPCGDANAAAKALARTLDEPEESEARVRRARARAQTFRLGPYLAQQEEFVVEAHDALIG